MKIRNVLLFISLFIVGVSSAENFYVCGSDIVKYREPEIAKTHKYYKTMKTAGRFYFYVNKHRLTKDDQTYQSGQICLRFNPSKADVHMEYYYRQNGESCWEAYGESVNISCDSFKEKYGISLSRGSGTFFNLWKKDDGEPFEWECPDKYVEHYFDEDTGIMRSICTKDN